MMNLKTHTGYPEIQVDEDFTWVAKIIAGDGKVLKEFTNDDVEGEAKSRPEAIDQACDMLAGVADDYIRPVEKEEDVITSEDVGTLEVNTKEGA